MSMHVLLCACYVSVRRQPSLVVFSFYLYICPREQTQVIGLIWQVQSLVTHIASPEEKISAVLNMMVAIII